MRTRKDAQPLNSASTKTSLTASKNADADVTTKIRFVIHGLPKSLNDRFGRTKGYLSQNTERQNWKKWTAYAVMNDKPSKPFEKAKITYIRRASRFMDCDNLVAGFKAVQDGLVSAGIIVNDSWDRIGMPTYLQEKTTRENAHIEVIVEDVSPKTHDITF